MEMGVLMIEFDFEYNQLKSTPFKKGHESYLLMKKNECILVWRLKLKCLHEWSDPFC